MFDFCQR
jgi:CRP/FNR family transcriptional regulator, cyclic AMP receptor protein